MSTSAKGPKEAPERRLGGARRAAGKPNLRPLPRGTEFSAIVVSHMGATLAVIGSAVAVFAVTNIDDLIVLTALFGVGDVSPGAIVIGQYLGLAALLAASVVGAVGLLVVPERWVGLLGVVPLALGVRGLLRHHDGRPIAVKSMLGVAVVTIANGADNISVYTPLLHKAGLAGGAIYAVVFVVLVAIWCVAGWGLARHHLVTATLERWGHRIVPTAFVAIGLLLLIGVARG